MRFNLDRKQHFKYLQLRSFVNTIQGNLNKVPLTQLEKLLLKNALRKGIVSDFYNLLLCNTPENSTKELSSWNEELSANVSEQEKGIQ